MSRAGVRSSDSTGGTEPREAGDRTVQPTKETSSGRINWAIAMPTCLWAIADKARRDKQHRFGGLARLLTPENLKRSFGHLKKKAAPGVDQQTWRAYHAGLEHNVGKLVERLKANQYRARLVRRKSIPKPNGKTRPLGILVVEDKMVQRACADIVGAIYEEDFLDCSYAYRPGRGAKDAVQAVTANLQFGRYRWVVEADIKGFYDHIDHEKLMGMLAGRINDGGLLRLIGKWLKAGILEEDGKVINPQTGTPQGGIISPVLANIYLHHILDQWFEERVRAHSRGAVMFNRYADDFISAFEDKADAQHYLQELGERLKEYGLELALDKTRMIRFSRFEVENNESFEYLGFEFRWERSHKGKAVVKRRTSRKKLRNSVDNLTEWCQKGRHWRISRLMSQLASKLRGYWNYYGVIGNQESQWEFYRHVQRVLYKWLNRRSQHASYTWAGLTELFKQYGIPRPRVTEVVKAKPSSGCL